tara:strand:+ start:14331 stop:15515 length:1185 start_codon:yes stop_codon:yes gene_type:complete
MNNNKSNYLPRTKSLIAGILAMTCALSAQAVDKIKVGLLLPYSGTYAVTGESTTNGLNLALEESGGKFGGLDVEFVAADSEANAGKAVQNMQRLVNGAKVDVVVGPMHSGVGMGAVKVARDTGVPLIIANAGFNAATGPLCAPNILRTSFTSWQTAFPMGKVAHERGLKNIVTITWRYGFGTESVAAFKQGFEEAGGKVIKEIYLPFPDVEFQAQLTEIASLNPDAVFAFFAGGGAAKFVQDYASAGLQGRIPLLGSGFLNESVLQAQGKSAEKMLTTLHYSEDLDNPRNTKFRADYLARFGKAPDIYSVQGFDTGLLLNQAVAAIDGDITNRAAFISALQRQSIDSPRGSWSFSSANNPVQNIYLREVHNGANVTLGVAAANLADPAIGCNMQ